MGSKSKSKPDCIDEINLPSDKLIDAMTKNLKEKHGLTTKRLSIATNELFSEDHLHSFRKAVIETIPTQIEWSVEKLSPTQCRLAVFFPFPPWLRNRFCSAFIVLSCLFSIFGLVIRYSSAEPKDNTYSFPLVTLTFTLVAILTFMVFIILLCLYFRLLRKYIIFWRSFLQDVFGLCRSGFASVSCRTTPVKGRLWIDWKVLVLAMCAFFGAPLVFFREDLLRAIVTSEFSLIFLVFSIVLALFYSTALRMRNKHSLITKVGATTPNFCLVCFIGLFLFGIPTAMYGYSKTVIHYVNTAATGNSVTVDYQKVVPHSSDITSSTKVVAALRIQSVGMICSQFFLGGCAIALLVVSSRDFAYLWSNRSMEYNRLLRETFHAEVTSSEETDRISLRLPVIMKISLVLLFLALSAACWAGVFLNLSLVNALVAPNFRLIPLSHGDTIVNGITLMAGAVLGKLKEDGSVRALRLLFAAPAVFPFFLFIFLTFRAFMNSHLRLRHFALVKGSMAAKANEIATRIGVSQVHCLLDSRSNSSSPYAAVRGWRPRNIIVFSRRSLALLTDHPECAEAILAHEVGHLKHDCLVFWILRGLSRLSLVGIGFLGVLQDSIAMEDRADDVARRYLHEIAKDENLLTEAAFLTEAQYYLDSESLIDQQTTSVFFLKHNRRRAENSQTKESFLRRITAALRIAHDLYFHTELYDYVHREARYRRT